MLTWVMYDIVKDKIRNKVSKCCEQAGIYRVQYSVFLGELSRTKCKGLSCQIEDLINPEIDRVYIFSRHKFSPEYIEPVHQGVLLSTVGKKFLAPLLLEHFDEIIRYRNKNRKRIDMLQTDAHAFANYLIDKRENYLETSINRKLQNFLNSNFEDNGDEEC